MKDLLKKKEFWLSFASSSLTPNTTTLPEANEMAPLGQTKQKENIRKSRGLKANLSTFSLFSSGLRELWFHAGTALL